MVKKVVILGIIVIFIVVRLSGCFENEKNTSEEYGVVVETSSMGHGDSSENGIIDKGDIVFYAEISNKSEIITWAQGESISYKKYGDYGDVILFKSMNDSNMQILHRAMCWVEYHEEYGTCTVQGYEMMNVSNITIAELDLEEYKPGNSGFITKADKKSICDQASGVCSEPVKFEWIIGKIVKLQDK